MRILLGWVSAVLGLATFAYGVLTVAVAAGMSGQSLNPFATTAEAPQWTWGFVLWSTIALTGLAMMGFSGTRRWGSALLAVTSLTTAVIFYEFWQAVAVFVAIAAVQVAFALTTAPARVHRPNRRTESDAQTPPWLAALATRDEDV